MTLDCLNTPYHAKLRKQWSLELKEKFNLPSVILEAKSFRDALKTGYDNPWKVALIEAEFKKLMFDVEGF
jgi:hypothetical protein